MPPQSVYAENLHGIQLRGVLYSVLFDFFHESRSSLPTLAVLRRAFPNPALLTLLEMLASPVCFYAAKLSRSAMCFSKSEMMSLMIEIKNLASPLSAAHSLNQLARFFIMLVKKPP